MDVTIKKILKYLSIEPNLLSINSAFFSKKLIILVLMWVKEV